MPKDIDMEFINRAMKVTSFNLKPDDFISLKFKKEIQYLFNTHFFPSFDISKTIKGVDVNKINRLVDELKSISKANLANLHTYNLKGVGPGEATLFFLIDDAHLGGGASAGVDLVAGGKKYEIKAVDATATEVFNFKTGGTFDISSLIARAMELKKRVNGGGEGVNQTVIKKIKDQLPDDWKQLESDYQDVAYKNYFKDHEIIFINNMKSKADFGKIITVKKVKKDDIIFERVTSGTIKPRVKI